MININIKNFEELLNFETKDEVSEFLQNERKLIESLWYLSDNKILTTDKGSCFGDVIRSTILNHYDDLIFNIHQLNFNIEDEISTYYEERKIIYSKSTLFKEIQKERVLKKYKLAIYILGIFTNSIENEKIENEIFELAEIKIKEFERLNNNLKPYRVLIIDGGGILGYYEASLLYALDKHFNSIETDVGDAFNMICGTSTGAILATGLATGMKLSEMKDLYRNNAKDIFPNPTPEKGISLGIWFLKHLWKPSASQKVLKNLLNNTFKKVTFSEMWKKRKIALCIPSLLVDTHSPRIFRTPHEKKNDFNNLKLSDACLASSAAPIYFPLAKIREDESYTDGGLWANNPILIGLSEALKVRKENQPIEIYSLNPPIRNEATINFPKEKKQGILHWKVGINIVNMSLFAQSEGYNNIANDLVNSLWELEQDIKIINFPEGVLVGDFLKNFGLDKNDDNTFSAMDSQVKEIIHNISKSSDFDDFENLFKSNTL